MRHRFLLDQFPRQVLQIGTALQSPADRGGIEQHPQRRLFFLGLFERLGLAGYGPAAVHPDFQRHFVRAVSTTGRRHALPAAGHLRRLRGHPPDPCLSLPAIAKAVTRVRRGFLLVPCDRESTRQPAAHRELLRRARPDRPQSGDDQSVRARVAALDHRQPRPIGFHTLLRRVSPWKRGKSGLTTYACSFRSFGLTLATQPASAGMLLSMSFSGSTSLYVMPSRST